MGKVCDYATSEWKRRCQKQNNACKVVRIKYKPMEEDVLYLCEDCALLAAREARTNGWYIKVRDMEQH